MGCARPRPANSSRSRSVLCYCPSVKNCAVLLSIALLVTTASAKQVSGPIKPSFVFGKGLDKESYTLAIDVPAGLEVKESFGELRVRKSFFEELKFELYSTIPKKIGIDGKTWVIQDPTAKSELLLETKSNSGRDRFSLYRRLNPANPGVLLNCSGEAETKAVYQAMLKICRTAKLQ